MERILYGNGIISSDIIMRLSNGRSFALITDKNVYELYRRLFDDFETFVAPAGESCKTLEVYAQALTYLNKLGIVKGDLIIAVGGGAVTDLAGFLASTYKRGIGLVNIPTSLIGMCDAGIGGKNSLNTDFSKNAIGSFYKPDMVLIEPVFLRTLPTKEIRNGYGEIIKYAIGFSPEMLDILSSSTRKNDLGDLIEKSIYVKMQIVNEDFKDEGSRHKLNFGHTLAHAIEHVTNYRYSHGDAVAIGCYKMCKWAQREGKISLEDMQLVDKCYENIGLKKDLDVLALKNKNEILDAIKNDKKLTSSNTIIEPMVESLGNLSLTKIPIEKFCSQILKDEKDYIKIDLPVSKSYMHRYLILGSLAGGLRIENSIGAESMVGQPSQQESESGDGINALSLDIQATINAMRSLAHVSIDVEGRDIQIKRGVSPEELDIIQVIDCNNSATTARLCMPLVNLTDSTRTGIKSFKFIGGKSLNNRTMELLGNIFRAQSMLKLGSSTKNLPMQITGRLMAGIFRLRGDVSSQFISGLLLAAPLLGAPSIIEITGCLESKPYVDMTVESMLKFGARIELMSEKPPIYKVHPSKYISPDSVNVEKDYSQAAFWIVYEALRQIRNAPLPAVHLPGLNPDSIQADKAILDIIDGKVESDGQVTLASTIKDDVIKTQRVYNLSNSPDILPIVVVYLVLSGFGGKIIGIERNRLKESDRVSSMIIEMTKLGAKISLSSPVGGMEAIEVFPSDIYGCKVSAHNDHRVAMSLTIAGLFALESKEEFEVDGINSVLKSYPRFINDLEKIKSYLD